MVAAMDTVGVDGEIFISAFSMYRYDASYAVDVQRAHSGRFALVKPVDPHNPAVADVCEWGKFEQQQPRPGTGNPFCAVTELSPSEGDAAAVPVVAASFVPASRRPLSATIA